MLACLTVTCDTCDGTAESTWEAAITRCNAAASILAISRKLIHKDKYDFFFFYSMISLRYKMEGKISICDRGEYI